ncbi:hypothetical protein VR45_39885 [Streptomyces sp. NRRL S-495]|nr:hypothetical protein VR45_39885 [Streptomyces sp. NRRL S-495]
MRRPSRARAASEETPLAERPSSRATFSAGRSSTTECHSTDCHRSGSERNAATISSCSAEVARIWSGERACSASSAQSWTSSVGKERRSLVAHAAAVLRTTVRR